jgi:predicted sugar kinase
MRQSSDHPSTRRVVLPTGQEVDVLFVQGGEPDHDATGGAAAERTALELHVCPACASSLVAPVAWEQAGPREWAVTIQCPNCEWWDADVFDEDTVERFDEALDRGTEALVRDLLRLMRANMEDDVERFLAALRADAILPEDF